jgi:hypothetical protein
MSSIFTNEEAPPSSKEAKQKREAEQVGFKKTCDKYIGEGLNDPTIQFLLQRLTQMGCPPPKGFIRCMDCGDDIKAGGGFGLVEETIITKAASKDSNNAKNQQQLQIDIQKRAAKEQCQRSQDDIKAALQAEKDGKVKLKLLPEIFLCQQHLRDKQHATESITHELIHAVDLCRYDVQYGLLRRIETRIMGTSSKDTFAPHTRI